MVPRQGRRRWCPDRTEKVGGWHDDPCRGSLGLLPSGPDPVGEWLVHHQPPGFHIGNIRSKCKPSLQKTGIDMQNKANPFDAEENFLTTFTLDERLERDGIPIGTLGLCQMRLMNDRRWPWLILVPQRADIKEVFELTPLDQAMLTFETNLWRRPEEGDRRRKDQYRRARQHRPAASRACHRPPRRRSELAGPGLGLRQGRAVAGGGA